MTEISEVVNEYPIPNEVTNLLMLHKKGIEQVDLEDLGQNRVSRVLQEFKLENEELNMPTSDLTITDIDVQDLRVLAFNPEFLSIIPEQIPFENSEVSEGFRSSSF